MLFSAEPFHPSLQFKRIAGFRDVYSARVGAQYRVLGVREGEQITWYWIGSHGDYDRLLGQR